MTTQSLATSLPTKVLYCYRSGVPLVTVTALCGGQWPFIQQVNTSLLHPVYALPLSAVLTKMKDLIDQADEAAWMLPDNQLLDLRLCMSAVMYQLEAIWQPPAEAVHLWNKLEPSLPCEATAAACASRLFKIARWYHFATSKRMELPLYRISKGNNNLHWENYSAWVDDAWSVRQEWESGRAELSRQHELQLHTEALQMIRSADVLKRLDFRKVWGWIDLQMKADSKYGPGRRETLRSIFLTADTQPELWTLDDIEDLQEAVINTCDRENDVYFFVNTRLVQLHANVKSFYGSFTFLHDEDEEATGEQAQREQAAKQAFFADYDRQIESLDQLPPEPQRAAFVTMPKYLQAMAQWRILRARFEASQKRKQAGV
jgi:hypothetical protein